MALRRNRPAALVGVASLLTVGMAPLLLSAGPAQAARSGATARVAADDDGNLNEFIYQGGPGRNQVVVAVVETGDFLSFVHLVDDVVPIRAGTSCAHPNPDDRTVVACVIERPTPTQYNLSTQILLGDGNDKLTLSDPLREGLTAVDLGAGNDTYVTTTPTAPDAHILAGSGNDTLKVGKQATVYAGTGNDRITIIGGGPKQVTAAVVYAGPGNDVIKGGPGADYLWGEGGDDLIRSNRGDDLVTAGLGNDEVHGGPGNDEITGNTGNDVLFGDAGDDDLRGGPGRDKVFGGSGKNTVTD